MRFLGLLLLVVFATTLTAQTSRDASIELTATTQSGQITLNWPADANATQWLVYRRAWGGTSFTQLGTLAGTATTWTDSGATSGTAYEYAVIKGTATYNGAGMIVAGHNLPAVHDRGKLILVVDNSFTTSLASKLTRLEEDLTGDGWQVIRIDVSRTDTPANIRSQIQTQWAADTTNTKSVFLFGHISVPHSGEMNPDAHGNHIGAWPTDLYYGEMNGTWTDSSVNNTSSANSRNHNTPGDGNLDQNVLPNSIEMAVGRVDLAELPAFTQTEEQLLEAYLDKDHEFRTAQWRPQDQAVVRDNFGYFSGEAFAASGYRSFAPMVGPANVTTISSGTFFSTLTSGDYLWAYGCGGGSYTSAGGVGNTSDFASNAVQVAFTSLFGSYHGDWDYSNAFIRAPLASGKALTCAWSGRPNWYFHSMAIGEPIGASLVETANRPVFTHTFNNWVHTSLMGDPSLRLHYVAPATAPNASQSGATVTVSWTASTDTVDGYYVYRATAKEGPYTQLTAAPVTSTTYDDLAAPVGSVWYMVRAAATQQTPSASYENLATGALLNFTVAGTPPTISADPSNRTVGEGQSASFTVTASGTGLTYQWQRDGGDISGATSATYTLPLATLADDGAQFACVVSNTYGNVTSATATLTVDMGSLGGGIGSGGGGGGGGGCAVTATPSAGWWMLGLVCAAVVYRTRRRHA